MRGQQPPTGRGNATTADRPEEEEAAYLLRQHDWVGDTEWRRYLQGFDLPAEPLAEAAAIRRLQLKYLRARGRHTSPTPPRDGASSSTATAQTRHRWWAELSEAAANVAVVVAALLALLMPHHQHGDLDHYSLLLAAVCATCALHLFRTLGVPPLPPLLRGTVGWSDLVWLCASAQMPQLAWGYWARLVASDSAQYLFLSLILLNERHRVLRTQEEQQTLAHGKRV